MNEFDLFGYKPEVDYKPERHRDIFSVADWVLCIHQALNRARSARDILQIKYEIDNARDDLASLAGKLTATHPEMGAEILAAIAAYPQFDFGEIDYLVKMSLAETGKRTETGGPDGDTTPV